MHSVSSFNDIVLHLKRLPSQIPPLFTLETFPSIHARQMTLTPFPKCTILIRNHVKRKLPSGTGTYLYRTIVVSTVFGPTRLLSILHYRHRLQDQKLALLLETAIVITP